MARNFICRFYAFSQTCAGKRRFARSEQPGTRVGAGLSLGMKLTDELSSYYAELLEGTYDCVDRIVLNAYFKMGQTGGGLRTWWRQLHGSDASLDAAHLRELAGA